MALGHVQRAAKKVREAKKLLVAANEQAPELDLALIIAATKGAEDRAAELLRTGIRRKDTSV